MEEAQKLSPNTSYRGIIQGIKSSIQGTPEPKTLEEKIDLLFQAL